jgi:hypothetical protein
MSETVSIEVLTEYLEKFGWKHYNAANEPGEEEGIIYTGWRSSSETRSYDMSIDPMVEKNCLSFRVYRVVEAPWDNTPPDRLADLLTVLNWVNFRIILGKFGYDVSDGEVRFSIDLPIDENDLTYAQFHHAMGVIINTVETWDPHLQAILAGEETLQEVLVESARESGAPDEFIGTLQGVLGQRGGWGYDEPLTEV